MSDMVKCLIWDLDNTVWRGTLVEADGCRLKKGVKSILSQLDKRGILLSIASANDQDLAISLLCKKGIDHFFLYPQIGWANKVSSIYKISKALDIPLNALGFIDDEPYEIEQVKQLIPPVRTYLADEYTDLLNREEFNPSYNTKESQSRRMLYVQGKARENEQNRIPCSLSDFLISCGTEMTLRRATYSDLPRLLELMHRTHQLNATGHIYTEVQIRSFLADQQYKIYVAELRDRFVDYGRIGLAIVHCFKKEFRVIAFLLSCRILGRGVGTVFLTWLQAQACKLGYIDFNSCFAKNSRNHRMQILFRLAGMKMKQRTEDGLTLFSRRPVKTFTVPEWLTLAEETQL